MIQVDQPQYIPLTESIEEHIMSSKENGDLLKIEFIGSLVVQWNGVSDVNTVSTSHRTPTCHPSPLFQDTSNYSSFRSRHIEVIRRVMICSVVADDDGCAHHHHQPTQTTATPPPPSLASRGTAAAALLLYHISLPPAPANGSRRIGSSNSHESIEKEGLNKDVVSTVRKCAWVDETWNGWSSDDHLTEFVILEHSFRSIEGQNGVDGDEGFVEWLARLYYVNWTFGALFYVAFILTIAIFVYASRNKLINLKSRQNFQVKTTFAK